MKNIIQYVLLAALVSFDSCGMNNKHEIQDIDDVPQFCKNFAQKISEQPLKQGYYQNHRHLTGVSVIDGSICASKSEYARHLYQNSWDIKMVRNNAVLGSTWWVPKHHQLCTVTDLQDQYDEVIDDLKQFWHESLSSDSQKIVIYKDVENSENVSVICNLLEHVGKKINLPITVSKHLLVRETVAKLVVAPAITFERHELFKVAQGLKFYGLEYLLAAQLPSRLMQMHENKKSVDCSFSFDESHEVKRKILEDVFECYKRKKI